MFVHLSILAVATISNLSYNPFYLKEFDCSLLENVPVRERGFSGSYSLRIRLDLFLYIYTWIFTPAFISLLMTCLARYEMSLDEAWGISDLK